MSVYKNYYVIAGYDLTGYTTDKYKEWQWSAEWEDLTCRQTKGNIQLFYDPMCGNFLYLGYILAAGDEYEFETTKINVEDVSSKEIMYDVTSEFNKLVDAGLIKYEHKPFFPYRIIVFEECT